MPTPLKDFSTSGLLRTWARSKTYQQAADHLVYLGFDATADTFRRRVRYLLQQRRELPLGRKPTTKDYQRIKAQYLADWENEDIL